MKYCPTCYLPESELDTCNRSDFGIPCPAPVEENPAKTVTLKCGPCEFTRVVPLSDLLSGKAKGELPKCHRDECACEVVPAAPASVMVLDPLAAALQEGLDAAMPPANPILEEKLAAKKAKAKATPKTDS